MNLNVEAQQFLFSAQKGVLSTHSAKFKGYPFGSVMPFVLNHQGMPAILISSIAEHTKNIMQDSHVSLMLLNDEADVQANSRLTLLAKAEQTDKNNDLMKARYLRYLPQAESYFTMHDFTFYTLHITQARYIAGFGKMGWVEAVDLQIPTYPLMVEEPGILEHMNKDHVANLTAYCLHYYQVVATSVEMIGIDSLGFDVRIWRTVNQTDEPQILRFVFKQTVTTAQEARVALVQMANACRS